MPYSLDTLTSTLSCAGVQEAREEAMWLLTHFLHISRASLLCDCHRLYDAPSLEKAVQQRLAHYPLQYILGCWDFFGLSFRVDDRCLIPRPDTEILVEEAVRLIPSGGLVADLCTGSGCIAVALLATRRDLQCAALELYPDTLALAVENAAACGVQDRFLPVQADLLQGGADKLAALCREAGTTCTRKVQESLCDVQSGTIQTGFSALLSNPPYISHAALAEVAPELSYEPRAALDGGEDGLTFYRAILTDYRHLLIDGGLLFLEIGYDQAEDVKRLAERAGSWRDARVVKDLGGRDRVVILHAAAVN